MHTLHVGETNTTMNVHLLGHLPECVRQWGPLWAYTCFQYENMNGHLKKLFHGTRNMSKQVIIEYDSYTYAIQEILYDCIQQIYILQMAFSFVAMQSLPHSLPKLQQPSVSELARTLCGIKRYYLNMYNYGDLLQRDHL